FTFWFKAHSAPPPGASGLDSIAGIWEQGAATRGIQIYLWRDPADSDPDQATLVFHAFNNAADGPGSPFGTGGGRPAVFTAAPVRVGEIYHVAAVMDGDSAGTSGNLILYINGEEVARSTGVGQLYAHTGDVQIGRGNGLYHNGAHGNVQFFDGVLDELALYNTALPPARVQAHHAAGTGAPRLASPPQVQDVATYGDPNGVTVTFDQPVLPATATNTANYTVRRSGGTPLPISDITPVPGANAVTVRGAFGFQPGSEYEVAVRDVTNLAIPGQVLSPNPTVVTFTQPAGGGPVGISPASVLGDVTATENQRVRFEVVATGAEPYWYQWYFNDVALSNETNSVLEIVAVPASAGQYRVRVANTFSEVVSEPATLRV